MDRRRFLAVAGAAAVGSLAGCGGSSDGSGQSIDDHPAAAGLADLPRRGELGGHVVLAFEDPSCSRCAAFHRNTLPEIRSNVVEPGLGAYVARTYPVVYPWGEPATQALASTDARDRSAFWSLFSHYFAQQSQFSTDTVYDRTETFLSAETDLDGTAVVDDAREEVHDDAVQANIDAAENAGLGQTTPVVLLFRDGEFVTKANGSVSYDLIAEALEVEG